MEWAFDVIDHLSAPMKAMTAQIDTFEKRLHGADEGIKKAEGGMGNFGRGAKSGAESAGIFGSALEQLRDIEVAEIASEAAEKVFELGKEFVEAGIEAAGFKRSSVMSLEAILGTKDAAEEAFDSLQKMARGTKMTGDEMIESFKQLSAQGLGTKAAQDVLAASADVLAAQGKGAQQALLSAVSSAMSMGKLTSRSLMSLKEVGAANPEKLMALLAEQHHTTEDGIKKMIAGGQISSTEGINALLDLVQKNADKGGALGSFSKMEAKGDVAVQAKNLKDAFTDLFESAKLEPIAAGLEKITAMLDPTTASGKKLGDQIGKAFEAIGKTVQWAADHVDDFIAVMDVVEDVLGIVGSYLGLVARFWEKVGEAIGIVVFAAVDAFENFTARIRSGMGFIRAFASSALDAGKDLVMGFVNGIMSGLEGVEHAVAKIGTKAIAGLKGVLGIHSPSKVMMELGGFTAEGFNLGMAKNAMDPMDALMPAINSPAIPSEVPRAPKLGGGTSISIGDIVVNITGAAPVGGDPHAHGDLAKEIGHTVRAEILRALEGVSLET